MKLLVGFVLLGLGTGISAWKIQQYRSRGGDALKEDLLGVVFDAWPDLAVGLVLSRAGTGLLVYELLGVSW